MPPACTRTVAFFIGTNGGVNYTNSCILSALLHSASIVGSQEPGFGGPGAGTGIDFVT
jgi:hypothetical protein